MSESDFLWEFLPTPLATILPLKSKLCRKFPRFNAIDGSIKMLKISINMKNFKTFCKTQTASHFKEVTQQIKAYYVSGTKIFSRRYAEIYRHLHSKCFKNAVLGRLEMVQCQCFFWHQPNVCWKIYKVRKVFGCVSGACIFQRQERWVTATGLEPRTT